MTVGSDLVMATSAGGALGITTGTLNVNGGAVNVGGNISLNPITASTHIAPTAAGGLVSTININSGVVTIAGNITKNDFSGGGISTANINMTGGSLIMSKTAGTGDIGSSAFLIDNFSIRGSSSVTGIGNLGVINLSVAGPLSVGGSMTVGNNGSVNMQDSAAGTLSVGSNLTLSGASTLSFDLSNNTSSGNDQINATGNLTIGGATTITVLPLSTGFTTGDYDLITYAGTGTFTGAAFNPLNTSRSTMTVNNPATTPNKVQLHINAVSPHTLVWAGGTSNTWSWNSTCWTDTLGSPAYYDLDIVRFDDTNSPGGTEHCYPK